MAPFTGLADDGLRGAKSIPGQRTGRTVGFAGAGERSFDDAAEQAYATIRIACQSDLATVAHNSGLPEAEVKAIKKHIFYVKHQLPAEGGQTMYRSRFVAHDEIAFAWRKAQSGPLDDAQKDWFRKWADHELKERELMGRGIPYRNPASWDPATEMWKSAPPGAHDLAPPHPPYGTFPSCN